MYKHSNIFFLCFYVQVQECQLNFATLIQANWWKFSCWNWQMWVNFNTFEIIFGGNWWREGEENVRGKCLMHFCTVLVLENWHFTILSESISKTTLPIVSMFVLILMHFYAEFKYDNKYLMFNIFGKKN